MARLAQIGRDEAAEYRGESTQPVASHAALLGVYLALLAVATLLTRAAGRELAEEVSVKDLVTMALGTHKISRAITKESVASPLRAPFTHHNGQGGPAEVMDEPRGEGGMRHAVGELVTCPFCLDVWIVSAFGLGLVVAPRLTRLVAGSFSALAGADFLQLAYARAQQEA
ncbi:DUF1360 domain-containing protein [Actinomycetospora sp. CA-101289]|uniref:DUF1360 domain-containing protein n=1 Tax=Actinomycetospora sp. CA-101289 TaxID=3239893 RepID=UPI003D992FCA